MLLRYLALLGVHFVINFALVPDNAVVSHPIHHDDYTNLGQSLRDLRFPSARPVSTLAIAAVAQLGTDRAYLVLNLALVACVLLCLRFVELWVRGGQPLPVLGFVAAGALAFEFAFVTDWTKYTGLLTNLSSALPGLVAMCALAMAAMDARRERALIGAALALAIVSFLAKEDFALPIFVTAATIAAIRRSRRWTAVSAAIAGLFVAAIVFNAQVGSVFVSGERAPTDPYFIDLSPLSLITSLRSMLLGNGHAKIVVIASAATVFAAVVAHRRDGPLALRLATLPAIAISILGANSIFPNHAYAYYGFIAIALLSATLAAATYALTDGLRTR